MEGRCPIHAERSAFRFPTLAIRRILQRTSIPYESSGSIEPFQPEGTRVWKGLGWARGGSTSFLSTVLATSANYEGVGSVRYRHHVLWCL